MRILLLCLLFSSVVQAETCRVVKKESAVGVLQARFRCAVGEHLGAVLPCRDDVGPGGYIQTLSSTGRSFLCTSPEFEYINDGYFCSEEDKDDKSCLLPIKADYLCCM
jgi:hypothetical protein